MSDCNEKKPIFDKKGIVDALEDIQKTLKSCCCCILKKLDEDENGDQNKQCLCVATSQCDELEGTETDLSLTLPANSCITKIYVSGSNGGNLDSILITVNNGTEDIFCQRFYLQGAAGPQGEQFETTLVQPLCVGDTESTVAAEFEGSDPSEGTLTVVYCTDCC